MIEKIKKNFAIKKEENSLKDKDIIDLNNKLKNDNMNISDLF